MWKRLAPAAGLFFLAPLVGEFLLGNLPITMLPALVALAPMYGGAALLIREIVRRRGLGRPAVLLLGLAFAVIQEAFVTRSLFDPDYAGLRLLDYGYVPGLGIGAWWTVLVLVLHAVWSIAVPVALAESLTVSRRETPWLGRPGLVVTTVLFVAGLALSASTVEAPPALSPVQIAVAASAVLLAIGVALRRPARDLGHARDRRSGAAAPSPWAVGLVGLLSGSAFWLGGLFVDADLAVPAPALVAAYLALVAAVAAGVAHWSRREGWGEPHRLALAGGALLTYAWHGFVQPPAVEASAAVDLAGDVVFALAAVVLLSVAATRVRRISVQALRIDVP